jgi:hypothetical protein
MTPINLVGPETRTGQCGDEFRGNNVSLTWGDFNQHRKLTARRRTGVD